MTIEELGDCEIRWFWRLESPIHYAAAAFELHAVFGVFVELDANAVGVGEPGLPAVIGAEAFLAHFVAGLSNLCD